MGFQIFFQYEIDIAGQGAIVILRQGSELFNNRFIQRNTDCFFHWFHISYHPRTQYNISSKEMYFELMRATEKSIRSLEQAASILKEAQLRCEDLYLESAEEEEEN